MTENIKEQINEVARRVKRQQPRAISDQKRLRSNPDKTIVKAGGKSGQLLRFTTGKVVDPSRCPKGISAHPHWQIVEKPLANGVNTVCACTVRNG